MTLKRLCGHGVRAGGGIHLARHWPWPASPTPKLGPLVGFRMVLAKEDGMSKVIAVAFDTEEQAREAEGVLHEMHKDGPITLYNQAIVVKEPDGTVAVRRQPKTPRVGTASGLVAGGLLGLLAGPAGAAAGLGAGALAGAAVDAAENGVDTYFVTDVGAQLEPGKAALVAEIDEDSEGPLDRRMEEIAGRPLRRTRTLLGDGSLDQLIEVSREELANMEAEQLAAVQYEQAEAARKETGRLQAKIDAARWKMWEKEEDLEARLQRVKEEGHEKIAVLEAQKADVSEQSHALLERRLADVRSDYETRERRLNEALERRKAAAGTQPE